MTKLSILRAAVVLAALTLAGLALSPAPCAKAQTRHDFQIWNAVFFTGQALRADKGPVFWFDAHARRCSIGTVLILRPGVGYALSSWASLWVGYAWAPAFVEARSTRLDMQGVWEQAAFTYKKAGHFEIPALS